ncbi:MAG: hypothetical protein COA42_07820 [Alteromonadaceae bacterium]|nr:MAG: hypothetical protein COA42_07820 [Alteromonadaceae bacterium]
MKHEETKELLSLIGDDRRVFRYFKDRYCLDLIDYEMQARNVDSMKVSELKSSRLNRILQKPVVNQMLKGCGKGKLLASDLMMYWPQECLNFSLSFTDWGTGDKDGDQTSRNQSNLVLQLNFDQQHTQVYQRLVKPDGECGPFEYWAHPVRQDARKTMAWVRMDMCFDSGEVLIEEIQTDWLRKANRALQRVAHCRKTTPLLKPRQVIGDIHGEYHQLQQYVEHYLKPYQSIWAEAAMAAALKFIIEELGMRTIYYHSFDTGQKIKRVAGAPPRSLYTQLPKRFAFEPTEAAPRFLQQDKWARRCIKAIEAPSWYCLSY